MRCCCKKCGRVRLFCSTICNTLVQKYIVLILFIIAVCLISINAKKRIVHYLKQFLYGMVLYISTGGDGIFVSTYNVIEDNAIQIF